MNASITFRGETREIKLNKAIDLSMMLSPESARAWYQKPLQIEPVRDGDFVGDVKAGSPVNFKNIQFNPHAHGTHTECYGHISDDDAVVSDCITEAFHFAELISIKPNQSTSGDFVIEKKQLEAHLNTIGNDINSLIIRTLPNNLDKCSKLYSDTNPAYLSAEAMTFIVDLGIEHLLIDLPSVDKEHDEGRLEAHKLFWNFPKNIRTHASITELIYVPNQLEDGSYLLQIQFPKFKLDASPSRISVWALN